MEQRRNEWIGSSPNSVCTLRLPLSRESALLPADGEVSTVSGSGSRSADEAAGLLCGASLGERAVGGDWRRKERAGTRRGQLGDRSSTSPARACASRRQR